MCIISSLQQNNFQFKFVVSFLGRGVNMNRAENIEASQQTGIFILFVFTLFEGIVVCSVGLIKYIYIFLYS